MTRSCALSFGYANSSPKWACTVEIDLTRNKSHADTSLHVANYTSALISYTPAILEGVRMFSCG